MIQRGCFCRPNVLLLALGICIPLISAQQLPPTDQPASPQSAKPQAGKERASSPDDRETATELTSEEIQSKITQIEGSTDLAEAQRHEILDLYRRALDQLNAANSWTAKAAEFRNGREEAPEKLEKVKAELDAAQRTTSPPAITEGQSLQEITTTLDNANRILREAQTKSKEVEDDASNRESRRLLIPGLIADANKRLENAVKELDIRQAEASPQLLAAKRARSRAQKRAAEAEIQAYEEELQYYTARRELLTARRELANLALSAAKERVSTLESAVARLRQQEVKQQQRQAIEDLSRTVGPLREIAERSRALADERARVVTRIDSLNKEVKRWQRLTEELDRDFRFLQESIQTEGMGDIVGPKLREKRTELRELAGERLDLQAKRRELAKAKWRLAEIEDEQIELIDVESEVASTLASVMKTNQQLDAQQIEQRARELFIARRDLLDALKKDFDAYLDRLVRSTAGLTSLLAKVESFKKFVARHVLWSRSTAALTQARFPDDWRPSAITVLLGHLLNDLAAHPTLYSFILLLLLVYLATRRILVRRLEEWGEEAARPTCVTFVPTVKALAATLLLAGVWPGLIAFLGWRVAAGLADRVIFDLAQAWQAGLFAAAYLMFLLMFVRRLAASNGLAESHFVWSSVDLKTVRAYFLLLLVFGVPSAFIVVATESYSEVVWSESVGRLALIAGMLPLSLGLYKLLHAGRGAFAAILRRHKSGWLYNLRTLWFPPLVILPLAIGAASVIGYHFTAIDLLRRLSLTLGLLLAIIVVHASMFRWLLVARRGLAIRRAEKIKASKKSTEGAAETTPQELRLEVVAVAEQTRSLLRAAVVVTLAIGVWSIWAAILPALSFLERIRLWTYAVSDPSAPEGSALTVQYITLDSVLAALVVVVAAIILAKNIPGLLEITILQKLPFDRGGRFAIASIARYTIGVVGLLIAFTMLGVSWSSVQWLIAAMTVGLGFGLQEIFANFVSGLIILFERPIRVGDTVTVGDITGDVTQIRIRATTITDWDRKELVIPNKEFVTGQVINWSLTDPVLRVIVPVGIAYGSDTDLAESILYKVARETKHVLADPEPKVMFLAFGDSSLNFELRVYVPGIDHFLKIRHMLHKAIDREFRQAGVEIAFPQRDLHIRSIHQALPVVDEATAKQLPARRKKRSDHEEIEVPPDTQARVRRRQGDHA